MALNVYAKDQKRQGVSETVEPPRIRRLANFNEPSSKCECNQSCFSLDCLPNRL